MSKINSRTIFFDCIKEGTENIIVKGTRINVDQKLVSRKDTVIERKRPKITPRRFNKDQGEFNRHACVLRWILKFFTVCFLFAFKLTIIK